MPSSCEVCSHLKLPEFNLLPNKMSLIKSYASKTNNFSLIPASCVKPVVAFIQLIGNQQGYLNLVHYLRYLHISINHRPIKANLKRDGERHNLLPVPSDIRVYLSA